jgi:cytidylate kinase
LRGVAAESPVELRERDRRDRTRTASPLAPAADSLILDSTRLSEDQVLHQIEQLVEQKLADLTNKRTL